MADDRSRILCLGEALIDRVIPTSSSTHAQSSQDYVGGAPANVAAALARLGTTVAFVGGISQDVLGQRLIQTLQAVGVHCNTVQRVDWPTRVVRVYHSEAGDRAFGGFNQADPTYFADAHLSPAALPENRFAQARWLVMGTLGLAYDETGAAMVRALALAHQYGLKVAVDLNWRPRFWPDPTVAPDRISGLLAQAHWLKFAAEEATWLLGETQPAAIATRYPNAEGILVTHGARGCHYTIAGHTGHVPAFSVNSRDTTGAGDAFWATLIHQVDGLNAAELENPQRIERLVTAASAAGAMTTQHPGAIAAQPSPAALSTFLQQHTGQPWPLG